MAVYKYAAVDREGNEHKGTIHARNKREVIDKLKSRGFLITSVEIRKDFLKNLLSFGKVPLGERMIMVKNLSIMHSAGLSLTESLKVLAEQAVNNKLKKALSEAQFDVESGVPLSASLVKYPNIFSEIFIQMIRIGEISGNLDKVLEYLAEQLIKEYDLRQKLKSALTYPIILVLTTLGLGVILTVFVLPRLVEIFKDFEAELPLTTRVVVIAGEFVLNYWLYGIIILLVLLAVAFRFLKTKKGKKVFSRIVLRLPIFGKVSREVNLARFTRTLANLVASGVPIVESIEIVGRSLSNKLYSKSVRKVAGDVKKGINLTKALSSRSDLFPPLVTRIVQVGEKTGKLEMSLGHLADYYEYQVDDFTTNFSRVIEPILLLIIGVVIGLVAVAIFAPIYSLVEEI
jgi:type IV pilus assembly protein PilC